MSRFNFVFSLLFISFLSACSSDVFLVHNGNMPTDDKIAQISKGQSRDEVLDILGSPSAVSTLNANEWLYMSSTVRKVAFLKPKMLQRDVLTIAFDENGQVNKISKLDKNDGQNLKIDKDETTSNEHDLGFFKRYFGGVGQYMPIGPSKE